MIRALRHYSDSSRVGAGRVKAPSRRSQSRISMQERICLGSRRSVRHVFEDGRVACKRSRRALHHNGPYGSLLDAVRPCLGRIGVGLSREAKGCEAKA